MAGISKRSDLVTMIYKWLVRDQSTDNFLNSDLMATCIQFAEAELNRELDVRMLRSLEDLVTVAGQRFIEVPATYWGVKALKYVGDKDGLEWVPEDEFQNGLTTEAGQPRRFTQIGSRFYFERPADAAYDLSLWQRAKIDPLVEASDTNVILDRYPDAYLYGAVRQFLLIVNDQTRLESTAAVYGNIISRIREDDRNSAMASGTRAIPARPIGGNLNARRI